MHALVQIGCLTASLMCRSARLSRSKTHLALEDLDKGIPMKSKQCSLDFNWRVEDTYDDVRVWGVAMPAEGRAQK